MTDIATPSKHLDSPDGPGNLPRMMRLADYVAQTLARHGIEHVFLVTGGGAMHLNDAIGRCPGLNTFAATTSRAAPSPPRAISG